VRSNSPPIQSAYTKRVSSAVAERGGLVQMNEFAPRDPPPAAYPEELINAVWAHHPVEIDAPSIKGLNTFHVSEREFLRKPNCRISSFVT
jgi:hypothetical protein